MRESPPGETDAMLEDGVGNDVRDAESAPPPRDQWSSKLDFILSVVGYAVGLGNVWRFPYLCYKNGGGAFFIPYILCLITGGVPLFFLEISLGQYMSKGGIGAWRIAPIFIGIGLATTIITVLLTSYYIVIIAWDLSYMAHSFTSVLPWSHCNNPWSTETEFINLTECANRTSSDVTPTCMSNVSATVDPVTEFWENKILQISPGIDQPDGIVWELAVALLLAWTLCYFCIWKGVKWTGKVVYVTAIFPYIMLTVLLIRGLTLDGAVDGIIFYLKPDFSRLADALVWVDAGTQIFFSYAIADSSLLALGSYNKFHNNFYRDCILLSFVNCFTSFYAGFVIFSVLGFMAKEQGVSVAEVAESGPGLAFIAYPKAVTMMPLPPLWAVLFFLMILLLGLDSQFVSMEGVCTVITDMFPQLTVGNRRPLFILGYVIVSYLVGLSMCTRGGMYVFQLFDYYSASGMVLLWVCFFESITVAWVYGGRRMYDNIEMMIGYGINPWMRICWAGITPCVTAAIFFFMCARFRPLTYNRVYEYPLWATILGMSMGFISMVMIPIYMVTKMVSEPGTLRQRWRVLTTPVLYPDRVTANWRDAAYLKTVGERGLKLDDRTMLFSRGNPAVTEPGEYIPTERFEYFVNTPGPDTKDLVKNGAVEKKASFSKIGL